MSNCNVCRGTKRTKLTSGRHKEVLALRQVGCFMVKSWTTGLKDHLLELRNLAVHCTVYLVFSCMYLCRIPSI
jgi:hypothetical protein